MLVETLRLQGSNSLDDRGDVLKARGRKRNQEEWMENDLKR